MIRMPFKYVKVEDPWSKSPVSFSALFARGQLDLFANSNHVFTSVICTNSV